MKRIISLLLVCVMLSIALVSCTEPDDKTTTGASSQTDEQTTGRFVDDDLPEDLKFDGEKVTILYWEDVQKPEFFIEDLTGDKVEDAIYYRNDNVQNRLDVELEFIGVKGNSTNVNTFIDKAKKSIEAGTKDYDIYAAYSRTAATCAINGFSENLLDLRYLNFDKPWWSQKLLDDVTIDGKLYFASGDISTNILYMMVAAFFNKKTIEDYKLDDPYQLVADNKWTLDKMIEMSRGIYQDLNNDGKKDQGDSYGMTTFALHIQGLFDASELSVLKPDKENWLTISPSFYGEKSLDFLNKICDWIHVGKDVYCNEDMVYKEIFAAGRSLFCIDRVYLATEHLADSEVKYGVLPLPKWDEEQSGYITSVANPYTLYSVSAYGNDSHRAAAVLECMASEAYRTTTPALFEVSFKSRYADANEDAQMYDLLRDTITYELGRLFHVQLNGIADKYFNQFQNNDRNWASTWQTAKPMTEAMLRRLIEGLKDADQ